MSINLFFASFKINQFVSIHNIRRLCSSNIRVKRVDKTPDLHIQSDVSHFFKINESEFNTLYKPQLKTDYSRLLTAFNDRSILIRSPAVEMINYLRHTDYSKPFIRYLLYGAQGVGKTVIMAHLSHYAVQCGDWLLLHMPHFNELLHSFSELEIAPDNSDIYDTPKLSLLFLKSFLTMNSEFLSKYNLVTFEKIEWNLQEYLAEGEPWTKMIEFALERPKYSSVCIQHLLKEIKHHLANNEFKAMILIKGVDELFKNTRFYDLKEQKIAFHQIRVANAFKEMISNDNLCNNGAVISSINQEMEYTRNPSGKYHPMELFDGAAFKKLDPFIPIHVENYTSSEMDNYLNFLVENHWLTVSSAIDYHGLGRKEIKFISGAVPENVFEITKEW